MISKRSLGLLMGLTACPAAVQAQTCAVSELAVAPPTIQVGVGVRIAFQATAYTATGAVFSNPCVAVSWNSSNVNVVRIDQNGAATGVAPGVAIITAQVTGADGVLRGQASVTVVGARAHIASVRLVPRQAQVRVGATVRLVATALDSAGSAVESARFVWISSDPNVAHVTSDGVVTGASPGRATVYVGVVGRMGYVGAIVEVAAASPTPSPDRR